MSARQFLVSCRGGRQYLFACKPPVNRTSAERIRAYDRFIALTDDAEGDSVAETSEAVVSGFASGIQSADVLKIVGSGARRVGGKLTDGSIKEGVLGGVPVGTAAYETIQTSTPETGHLRLEFDGLEEVSAVTYLGPVGVRRPDLIGKLLCLVGLPESVLNSPVGRFKSDKISDLVVYLDQPWTTAIYHSDFGRLQKRVVEALGESERGRQVLSDISSCIHNGTQITGRLREAFSEALKGEPLRCVSEEVIGFITKNRLVLPMYHVPEAGDA